MKNTNIVLLGVLVILLGIGVYFSMNKKTANAPEPAKEEVQNTEENIPTSGEKDGKYIGNIKSVTSENGKYSLTIDFIQWQNCDGTHPKDLECSNGYRILNTNPKLRTFPIAENASVRMQTFSHTSGGEGGGTFNWNEKISLVQFEGLIKGTLIPPVYLEPEIKNYNYTNYWPKVPFWITLQGGIITEISEQYVP